MKKFLLGALLMLIVVPITSAQGRCTFLFSNFQRDRETIQQPQQTQQGSTQDIIGQIFQMQIQMRLMDRLSTIADQQSQLVANSDQMLANQAVMMQWMTAQSEVAAKIFQLVDGMPKIQPMPSNGIIMEPVTARWRATRLAARLRSGIARLRRCCRTPAARSYWRLYRVCGPAYILRRAGSRTTQDKEQIVKEYAFYIRELVNNAPVTNYIHIGSLKLTLEKDGSSPTITPANGNGAGTFGGNGTLNVNITGGLTITHKGCQCGPNCNCPSCPNGKAAPVKTQPVAPPVVIPEKDKTQPAQPVTANPVLRAPTGLQSYTTRYPRTMIYRPRGGSR